jgi:hypothetical protein
MPKIRHRKRILIQPRLQIRLIAAFLGSACISVVVQILLLHMALGRLASDLPSGGAAVLEATPGIVLTQVILTFGLLVPLVVAVGTLETFRVAGPLYRFEVYLKDIVAGRKPGPCHIRKDDELQALCALLNEATQPLLHPEDTREQKREEQLASVPAAIPQRAPTTVVLD